MPSGMPKSRDRGDPEPVAEYVSRYFRMSGTVLYDRGILSKMEESIAGVYIPVRLAEGDTGSDQPALTADSQVFTAQQLTRLRSHVEEIVRETAEQLAAGDVAPRPMKKKQAGSMFYADACAYCDYHTLCGVTEQDTGCFRLPVKEKEAEAAMKAIMNGEREAETDEQMDT